MTKGEISKQTNKNQCYLLSQFSVTFSQILNEMPHFIAYFVNILVLIGMVFMIIWEMFYGRISLNFTSASEFNEWVQVGVDVYIPQQKYQIWSHSSQWFPAACAAAKAHRNPFFCLHKQNKSSESKVKFRQASIVAKGLLKLPNLHMLIKQKSFTSQKICSRDFWQFANSVLNKGKFAADVVFCIW